jgi:hypothetical protein
MSEELKACPFCGINAEVVPCEDNSGQVVAWFICCTNCPTASQICDVSEGGLDATIKAWNTRPIEDALHARVAELEKFGKDMIEASIAVLQELSDKCLLPDAAVEKYTALKKWYEEAKEGAK